MRASALVWVAAVLWLAAPGCGDSGGGSMDAGTDGAADATASDAPGDGAVDAPPADADVPLTADAGPSLRALVGEEVTLDGSGSAGATRYRWAFGDGDGWESPRETPVATASYDTPGRYRAVLTVFDDEGGRRTDQALVTVTEEPVFTPRRSSTVAVVPGLQRVAVVSTDSDELVLYDWDDADAFSLRARVPTADEPRSVAPFGDWLAVPCRRGGAVVLVARDGSETRRLELDYGALPHGAVAIDDALFVTLQGPGEVVRVELDASGEPAVTDRMDAITDARGIATLPGGRLAVSRFRSPEGRGEIAVLDPETGDRTLWTLAFDPQISSDTESGGVPSYLGALAVSPVGDRAAVASTQANIGEGTFRSDKPLTFETTVRGIVSYIDVGPGEEDFESRKQFDNRGLASAAVYNSHGDFLFLAMRGHRSIERIDAFSGAQSGSLLNVGYAPRGLALSEDDRLLFVDAFLSRELVVYDVSSFRDAREPIARLPTTESEPLGAELLRGKRLFNDSWDTRLSKDGYMACAHCHLDGMGDGRTWDFTDRGEGLRNTIALLGRGGTDDGPVHWSANFDEIQDFENDIRLHFRGDGLMGDADWESGTVSEPLGDPKAGLSEDLDALAAYVASLEELPSPHRAPDGSLTDAAERGKTLFESDALGCTDCHSGPRLTDSGFDAGTGEPVLHDVGTIEDSSGSRLGEALTGIDTPTLHGLWHSAPYLHDGSAATLREVLVEENPGDAHGTTSGLTDAELDDLIAYLLSLDGRRD